MVRSDTLRFFIFALLSVGWACMLKPSNLTAQEFRIESQVYVEGSTQPVSHNVTLFTPKMVCDFLMSNEADPQPVEIVIFERREKKLILLDPIRKVQVEIPDVQLIQLVDGLRRETMQNERSQFLINDTFEENTDWADGWVSLTSPSIVYRFKGNQPEDASLLPAYFEFLDQFTRLNASDPTKLPPFPRMRLNQTIKKLGWIPTEVQIEMAPNTLFQKEFKASSKHVFNEGLSNQDRQLISDAKKAWMQFESVDLISFRGLKHQKSRLGKKFENNSEKNNSTIR